VDLFAHDWRAIPRVVTEWQTDVVASAETLAEERRGLVGRPRRTVFLRWVGLNRDESARLMWRLFRACAPALDGDGLEVPLEVPIHADVAIATASSSGTTISAPTANRRFHAGGRVVICSLAGGRPTNPQWRTIDSVSSSSITVTEALTGSYAAGALVCPAIKVRTLLEAELAAQTDQVCEVVVAFAEVLEEALPARAQLSGLSAHGFSTADDGDGNDYHVLTLSPEWSTAPTMRVTRSGSTQRMGRDELVLTRGPRPRLEVSFGRVSRDRAEFDKALAFFDAHRGRLVPFFVPLPLTLFRAVAIATGYVDVAQVGDLDDVEEFASFVAVEANGSTYVRPIESVAVEGSAWRITVGVALPSFSLSDVTRVSLAILARFASDSLEEEWQTIGVSAMRFSVVEVVNEKVAGVTDPTWDEIACEGGAE
jgi:hypothetical protein